MNKIHIKESENTKLEMTPQLLLLLDYDFYKRTIIYVVT